MPAGPTLDVSEDYNLFDNQQDVRLVLPDGRSIITTALQEEVDTVQVELGDGALGFRQYCTWHLFRNRLNGLVPAINSYILDPYNQKWFVGACNQQTWGTRWRLTCEMEAGKPQYQLRLPPEAGHRIIYSQFVYDTPGGDRTQCPLVFDNTNWTGDNASA